MSQGLSNRPELSARDGGGTDTTITKRALNVRETFVVRVRCTASQGEETILRHADVASNCRGRIVEPAVVGRGCFSG